MINTSSFNNNELLNATFLNLIKILKLKGILKVKKSILEIKNG